MKETKLPFKIDIGDILDVDFMPDGTLISLQGFGSRQIFKLGEKFVELPETWSTPQYPHLRALTKNRFLLIDTHHNVAGQNALIINEHGKTISRFHVGAGVVDASATAGLVAVAYHADAAFEFGFEADSLSALGVAIFDLNGQMIACLNHELERTGFRAENIQCMVTRESGELVIIPDLLIGPDGELQSPILFYDWRMARVRWEDTGLTQPLALSAKGSNLYIYSPQEADENIIETDLTGGRQKTMGFFKSLYRGLSGGRFLGQLTPTEYQLFEAGTDTGKIKSAPLVEPRLLRHPSHEI